VRVGRRHAFSTESGTGRVRRERRKMTDGEVATAERYGVNRRTGQTDITWYLRGEGKGQVQLGPGGAPLGCDSGRSGRIDKPKSGSFSPRQRLPAGANTRWSIMNRGEHLCQRNRKLGKNILGTGKDGGRAFPHDLSKTGADQDHPRAKPHGLLM